MKTKFTTVSRELKFANPYWEYILEKYILPNGRVGEYHYINSNGATMIIPKIKEDTFIMVRQYRYLNNKFSLEFPGGGIANGLTAMENAQKELVEESGYIANDLSLIGTYNPFNGVTNEICSVFLAENLIRKKCNYDPSEEFEILEISEDKISEKIINQEIWDGMTLAAWTLYNCSNKLKENNYENN